MRSLIALPILALLSACGGGGAQPPVVDMTGVDPGRHSRDLAACAAERYTGQNGFIEAGNPLTNCMARKGYKVLVRN